MPPILCVSVCVLVIAPSMRPFMIQSQATLGIEHKEINIIPRHVLPENWDMYLGWRFCNYPYFNYLESFIKQV